MCGIVAITSIGPADLGELARAMTDVLAHRGPDDTGVVALSGEGVALGMRRLSIVDLEGGHQPMWDERRRYVLVFNGEIYNFAALKRELVTAGHEFSTDHSDTEVIVHGYEEWGPSLFARLNGMFAFAIWDRDRRELVLARDRAGEKPLYVARLPGGWAVASELKAILRHPALDRELDPIALEQFLAFDFVIGPRTILRAVQKLPAGHYAVIRGDELRVQPYWRLRLARMAWTERDAIARMDELLDRSVSMRMLADVPVGLFLSGGLDSTTVGYYMRRHSDRVRSFSIAFDERAFDESAYAALAARHLGTDHDVEVLSPDRVRDLLPRVTDILDEPMGDPSVFPTHLLSVFTRRHVKVALGGDGSDELLMGYRTYQALKLSAALDAVPVRFRRTAAQLASSLPDWGNPWYVRAKHLGETLALTPEHRLMARLGSFRANVRWVLSEDVRSRLPASVFAAADDEIRRTSPDAAGWANRTIAAYVRGYLQEDILVKVDRASMAASLEVRAPFLDPDLMDFLGTVEPALKLHGMTRKHLLRQLMRGRIPDLIIDRPKQGFGVPLDAWFRGPLAALVRERLAVDRVAEVGVFNPQAVAQVVSQHLSGQRDRGRELWLLLQFDLWRERWLEPAAPRVPNPGAHATARKVAPGGDP